MVKLDDYRHPITGAIDWNAMQKAEVANGDKCKTCSAYILFGKGFPDECHECKNLRSGIPEASHSTRIRCPSCAHVEVVDWERNIYDEGEHEVSCSACNADYIVETRVEYSFTCRPSND